MGLFAVTLMAFFVIRLGAEVIPSKPASGTSTTAKPTPEPTSHQTKQADSGPRTTSTYNAPLRGRRSSPTSTAVATLTIAPVPVVTGKPRGAPAPTAVPPGEVLPPPPADVPEPDPGPAPEPVTPATEAP
jgi:hypothetical protein